MEVKKFTSQSFSLTEEIWAEQLTIYAGAGIFKCVSPVGRLQSSGGIYMHGYMGSANWTGVLSLKNKK